MRSRRRDKSARLPPDRPRRTTAPTPEREQRRENNENNMEAFKGHLAKDRKVVPRQ